MHRRCCLQAASSVHSSLVLLRMDEIVARIMLNWLKLLINYCCIWLAVYIIVSEMHGHTNIKENCSIYWSLCFRRTFHRKSHKYASIFVVDLWVILRLYLFLFCQQRENLLIFLDVRKTIFEFWIQLMRSEIVRLPCRSTCGQSVYLFSLRLLPRGICGGQSGTGIVSPPRSPVFRCQCHVDSAPFFFQ